ncbi:helix-turn-helix transcriptional regulator [Sporosarcina aquimarina]|uniref:Helix-turn-helix transcriptional regulator n=1 Tax=Sporosarcina aquimarina TaxID=114975 RepID=A0ABU4G2M2_9BACL|nr:helix-turn-helix transcriptional regulator [Sporosarcina aquimarina]
MEERLKNFKKTVDQTLFKKVEFAEEHQQQIHKQMHRSHLTQTILSMLTESKSGMELTRMLHVRGVEQIVDNEGMIYSIIHEAEQQGWLSVRWKSGVKYYRLTKIGRKQVQQDHFYVKQSLKEVIWGGRMHVE